MKFSSTILRENGLVKGDKTEACSVLWSTAAGNNHETRHIYYQQMYILVFFHLISLLSQDLINNLLILSSSFAAVRNRYVYSIYLHMNTFMVIINNHFLLTNTYMSVIYDPKKNI